MASKTEISWTDSTWTPIRARVKPDAAEIATSKGYTSLVQIASKMAGHVGPHCEPASPGCENCYSEGNNGRCLPFNGTGLPFDRRSRDLVDIEIDEDILMQPMKWRRPRKIFACSQTDLFGEFVTDEMIDRVFAVMALCPQHTFQVLTKRAERMRAYFADPDRREAVEDAGSSIPGCCYANTQAGWPLPNVHLGVSVEDQQRADERIPHLLATPAAVRWVSYEPALGPINLQNHPMFWNGGGKLDWIVIGGESGPDARPFWTRWAHDTIAQCRAAGVPLFCKQLGPRPICWRGDEWPEGTKFDARELGTAGVGVGDKPFGMCAVLKDRKGGDMAEWPADLRVREYPEVTRA